jgi:hypothetical protein
VDESSSFAPPDAPCFRRWGSNYSACNWRHAIQSRRRGLVSEAIAKGTPLSAAGQPCPEGWTLYPFPRASKKGAMENGSTACQATRCCEHRLPQISSARRAPELHRLPIPVLQAHSRRDPGFCSAMPTWEWPASGMPAQLNPVAVARLGRS